MQASVGTAIIEILYHQPGLHGSSLRLEHPPGSNHPLADRLFWVCWAGHPEASKLLGSNSIPSFTFCRGKLANTSCSCGSAVGSSLCEAVTSDTALALLARSPACSSSVGGILPVFFLLVSPVPAPTFLVHCCHLRFLPDPLLSHLSLSLLRPWVTGSLASSLLCFGLLLLQHWGSRRQRTLPILSHLARRALQATLW